MEKKRKIIPVGRKVSFEQAEEDDLMYWSEKTWQERIIEAERLRRMIWGHRLGEFPKEFEKVGRKIRRSQMQEDDF